MDTGNNPSSDRSAVWQWIGTAVAGMLLFVGASAVFVGSLWVVNEVVADREIKIAAAFVLGLAFLLSIIASIVAAFAALKLTSSRSALGLPEGSIRAIIALVLVLIFVIMAVYLIEAVFTKEGMDETATNAATQLLATLGTLVAAVAAFYFGTSAVTTGAAAVTQAAAAGRSDRPTAITKGSALRNGVYWLVGIVNPNGLETNWYFQYGPDRVYGQQTNVAPLGAGDAETMVEIDAPDVQHGWHFRLAAFSEAGASYGDDAVVTETNPGAEQTQGGGGGPEGEEPQAQEQQEQPEEPPAEEEQPPAEEEQPPADEEEPPADEEEPPEDEPEPAKA